MNKSLISRLALVTNQLNTMSSLQFRGDLKARRLAELQELIAELPHGSGIDGDTRASLPECTASRVVLYSACHLMDESGFYDGWVDFRVRVSCTLIDPCIVHVTGNFPRKYADIRDYLEDRFRAALMTELD